MNTSVKSHDSLSGYDAIAIIYCVKLNGSMGVKKTAGLGIHRFLLPTGFPDPVELLRA